MNKKNYFWTFLITFVFVVSLSCSGNENVESEGEVEPNSLAYSLSQNINVEDGINEEELNETHPFTVTTAGNATVYYTIHFKQGDILIKTIEGSANSGSTGTFTPEINWGLNFDDLACETTYTIVFNLYELETKTDEPIIKEFNTFKSCVVITAEDNNPAAVTCGSILDPANFNQGAEVTLTINANTINAAVFVSDYVQEIKSVTCEQVCNSKGRSLAFESIGRYAYEEFSAFKHTTLAAVYKSKCSNPVLGGIGKPGGSYLLTQEIFAGENYVGGTPNTGINQKLPFDFSISGRTVCACTL